MSANVVSITPATTVGEARSLLKRHDVKALPVVDAHRQVKGIVTRADLADDGRERHPLRLMLYALARLFRPHAEAGQNVGTLMTTHVLTVANTTPIVELVRIFAGRGHHHVPVVDHEHRLAGIITQADLISGLYHQAKTPQQAPA
jgi:CBS domain-containing membrane protein